MTYRLSSTKVISIRDAMSQLNVFPSKKLLNIVLIFIYFTWIDKELEGEGEKRHDCLSSRVAAGNRTA